MAASRMYIQALLLLMFASYAYMCMQRVTRVKVEAALEFYEDNSTELLLIKPGFALVLKNNTECNMLPLFIASLPMDISIIAATEINTTSYYIFGPDEYVLLEKKPIGFPSYYYRKYPESLQKFFGGGGPDAVAHRDNRIFYFKGCRLATFDDSGILKQRNAQKLGLPCKPDAAWSTTDRTKIVLLKGDQIWIWDYRKRVDGPKPFSSMYNISSWELIPSSG